MNKWKSVLVLGVALLFSSLAMAGTSSFVDVERKAKLGDADAQFILGVMYANGRGVRQDDAQAVSWYRKAAEQGNAAAQSNLGFMYATGQGVRQNMSIAKEWYGKSCDNGGSKGCKAYKILNERGVQ